MLAQDTIGEDDFVSLVNWLNQNPRPRLTKGEKTVEYEELYAKTCGRKYAVMVNSGSSANLLMYYALICDNALKNKKIVVPALSWITTISPAIQFGLTPILCDINMQNLSVDLVHLEKIFFEQEPAAFILVTVLGMVPDMDSIVDLCNRHDVILIVDNCESQGSRYGSNAGTKNIESFGVMSSCSSYYGHISSTVEGGMVTTDDEDYYNLLKMLRSHGWDRDISEEEKTVLREKWNISGFNSLYTFYKPGFNLRSTDLNATIGIGQINKIFLYGALRDKNFRHFNRLIKNDYWKPEQIDSRLTSNLGYPVIHPKRDTIADELMRNGVEVRPLISGSMGKQPFFVELYGEVDLPNVSIVDKYGMYIPNGHGITEEDVQFMSNIINDAINN